MKYNIRINQRAVADQGLLDKLDLVDLALFDFIYDFFNSMQPGKITFEKDGVLYVEIRMALVNEQMPMLRFGSRPTYTNHMNKLIAAGLIERYENNQRDNRSGYTKGPKWDIFTFSEGNAKIFTPCKENITGCNDSLTRPVKKTLHNNTIIDNNIVVDARTHAHTREADEAFAKTFLQSEMANILMMQYHSTPAQLKASVAEILAEWAVADQSHTDYTDRMKHLINQLRIKLADEQRRTSSTTQSHAVTFRQQDQQDNMREYRAALAEAERRRNAPEQYRPDNDTGDVL